MSGIYNSSKPTNSHMVKLARLVREMSLEDAAEHLSLPADVLRAYEARNAVLSPNTLKALSAGYDFPIPFFYREGKLHPPDHVCIRHDAFDELLEPIQALLDRCVGDNVIMEVEWLNEGIYLRQYEADEDRHPFAQEKLGNTIRQAEIALRKLLRQEGLLRK